ncbi:MAG: flavodoxin [Lachnospiraceae bacterium]|nr:flavodoxin [Lachnospiraceae bacterium]
MRKIISIILATVMVFSLSACGSQNKVAETTSNTEAVEKTNSETNTETSTEANNEIDTDANEAEDEGIKTGASSVLVVYFSLPDDVDDSTVQIDGETVGNTQYMASVIQDQTGADMLRIEAKTPYTTDHEDLVDIASDEKADNARPEIASEITNLDQYDTVFVGYPIWWSDMPMIMYTLFDTYDFSGKTVIPFSTHGGSGFAGTPSTIAQLEPNATMKEGLSISRDDIQDGKEDIITWLNGLGF